jgi:hypothetical protein
MAFDTVYYSHFWYSRLAALSFKTLEGNVEQEIDVHRFNLRMLALFFKHIYVPRTHFITQLYEDQWEVPRHFFDSDEFAILRESGTLIVSTNPGLDDKQDTERIVARAGITGDIGYVTDKAYLEKIPVTQKLIIPTTAEQAAKNLASFPRYAQRLTYVDPNVSAKFLEIFKQSQIKDVPFFHESFLRRLKGEFQGEAFEEIWRATNSIYLTTGDSGQRALFPYFNADIESLSYRHEPFKLDRYLLSPASLYMFLNNFMTDKELHKYIFGPAKNALSFLDPRTVSPDQLDKFRASYFGIVEELSPFTRRGPLARSIDLQPIGSLQKAAIDRSLEKRGNFLEGLADDAKTVAGVLGDEASIGLLTLAKPGIKYGRNVVERFTRWWRFPDLLAVTDALKKSLK